MKKINEQDESLFYCDVEENEVTCTFINTLRDFSINNSKQIYIIKRALGSNKDYSYELEKVAIVLMPKHPILIIDYSKTTEEDQLEDFFLDFKEDLGFLADKYDYDKVLGRARKWSDNLFVTAKINKFDINSYLHNEIDGQNAGNVADGKVQDGDKGIALVLQTSDDGTLYVGKVQF